MVNKARLRGPNGRRFEASNERSVRDLQRTITRMGATNLRVAQEFDTGHSEVTFDRSGRRYLFRCEHWHDPADNLRATERTITLLYQALEEYGTTRSITGNGTPDAAQRDAAFWRFFLPFELTAGESVLLLGDGVKPWWEILGVRRDATWAEISDAYRALARLHHPDNGGDTESMKRINAAYVEARSERGRQW